MNILTRRKRQRATPKKQGWPQHLAWVRGFNCLIAGKHECGGRVEAHHVREGHTAGMGQKPPDYWAVPLCSKAHGEGHTIGWQTFETKYGVTLKEAAARLASTSPHRKRWEA